VIRAGFHWVVAGVLGLVPLVGGLLYLGLGGLIWDPLRRIPNRLGRWWGRAGLASAPVTVELRGADALAPGARVVVMNHRSSADLLCMGHLPFDFRVVVKSSNYATPLGLNLWLAGHLRVGGWGAPGDGRAVAAGFARWLAAGVSVLVFPGGSREAGAGVGRFRRGPFARAVESGVPVRPVVIAGSETLLAPRSLRMQVGGRIVLQVLPDIPSEGRTAVALRAEVHAAMQAAYGTLSSALVSTISTR
jgi:1-acyl-sn-glycerol-3-phosphate acyltransferase